MPRKWPRGYYAYVMCWPDGTPYYVGAGKNARATPIRKIFNGRCPELELRATGQTTQVEIFETTTKEDAFLLEEKLILQYGRLDLKTGSLFNRTNGRGTKGVEWPEERRECIAAAKRGQKQSAGQIEATRNRMLGNTHLLGHVHSEEARKKISCAGRGKKQNLSEAERRRRSEAMAARNKSNPVNKGRTFTPEHRKRISEARRKRCV